MELVLDNGNISLNLSEYDIYDDLKKELLEILNCTEEELLDRTMEDFTVELDGFPEMSFDGLTIDKIYAGYSKLTSYEEEEQKIIATYLCMNDVNLYVSDLFMQDAIDNYFGTYPDDYEAAEEFLTIYHDMNARQRNFLIDTLDVTDKIIDKFFDVYNDMYFFRDDN